MPNWTDEQLAAICERDGSLLVSAAAGSGKTAVLVERVLRRLTDPKDPIDIDRFLLVTYTNAAAAEMRGKIADAITARLGEHPDDARLRRQLLLVYRAQITTVHSFCLNLVREQFAALGLIPDFRIADEGELADIMEEAMEGVLEAGYEGEDEGFLSLSDLLSAGRDDKRLSQVVLEVFGKIQSHADPDAFLSEVAAMFAAEGSEKHRAVLLEEAKNAAEYGLACLKLALGELETDGDLGAAYTPAFTSDESHARALLTAIGQGWDAAVAAAKELKHDRLGTVRGYEDKEFQEYIKGLRKGWRDAADRIQTRLLAVDGEAEARDRALVAPAMLALVSTVRAFSKAFSDEKLRRGVVDFGDLEHFAVRLLLRDGQPTSLAKTVAASFDEIMVDEYQDTNAVQEAIFTAVSREGKNLFFVGDVKQSIYGFRLANPYIFLSKYRAWPDAADAEPGSSRRLNLTRNFRSRAGVLDATNYIFRQVMCEAVGDLDYTDREALYVGAAYPEPDDLRYRTEVLLLDTEEAEEDKTVLEAELAAGRIRQLLDEGFPVYDRGQETPRPAAPSDIVILLRSISRKAAIYRQALEKVGLTAETDESSGLLTTSEVAAVVSLLHVIDNPRQDVELIGALRSPLLGFSEQELAEIRLLDKKAEFYDAVCLAAQAGNEKAALFLQQLAGFRRMAADLPVCTLIERLYDVTGALGIYGALPNGSQRQANLLAFFERARAFEESGSRGLFRFTTLLRGMAERGEDWQTVHARSSGGAVRIMSIHKSKGLEFPIVILADCAKTFNEQDLRAPVLVHPELGLGPKCRDLSRGVQYPTVQRQAVAVRARREAVSEELRVLYVALTRAKEKLIITASGARLASELQKWSILAQMDRLPAYALASVRSTLPWMLIPLLRHPAAGCLRELAGCTLAPDFDAPDVFDIRVLTPQTLHAPEDAAVLKFEEEDLPPVHPVLCYDRPYLQDIPAKLTATGVKRGYKAAEAAEETPVPRPEVQLRQPMFDRQMHGLTPAERGTAHHLFMQFCDFTVCAQLGGVQAELNRMREKRILAPEQADAIEISRIEKFFASRLFREDFAAAKMRREFKFSVVVPAGDYYPVAESAEGETVLLQGVIDCLLETDAGFFVLDFKTDRVRAQDASARAEKYRAQLNAYARAVEEIFARPVTGKAVFFLGLGEEVRL